MTIREFLEKAYFPNEQVTVWIGENQNGGDLDDLLNKKDDPMLQEEVQEWDCGYSNIDTPIIRINFK